MKLGAAQTKARAAWRLANRARSRQARCKLHLPTRSREALRRPPPRGALPLAHQSHRVRPGQALAVLFSQIVEVEAAFKTLKGDLAIRPIFHQEERRIEAHIFIAFLAYCLHVTLGQQLKALAPGLTPRSGLEKFAAVQMIDVYVPTTDGRELCLTRYTQPEPELKLLIEKLKLTLPAQPPPKITAAQLPSTTPL